MTNRKTWVILALLGGALGFVGGTITADAIARGRGGTAGMAAASVAAAGAVMESDYDANTVLLATADNTPVAVSVNTAAVTSGLANAAGTAASIARSDHTHDQAADSVGSAEIVNDSIVNADINSAAAISISKTALVAGAGLGLTADTLFTSSGEAGFLLDGDAVSLTCGAGTAGRLQVMDDGTLEWCDGAATPVLRTVALGDGSGAALSGDTATAFFAAGTIEDARLSSNVSLLGQTISSAEILDAEIVNSDLAGGSYTAITTVGTLTGLTTAAAGTGAAILSSSNATADAHVRSTAAAATTNFAEVLLQTRNSAASDVYAGNISANLTDTTAGSTDSRIRIYTLVNDNQNTALDLNGATAIIPGNVTLGDAATDTVTSNSDFTFANMMRAPIVSAGVPAEPFVCGATRTGAIVWVDDTDDAAVALFCFCTTIDNTPTYDWRRLDDSATACPFF